MSIDCLTVSQVTSLGTEVPELFRSLERSREQISNRRPARETSARVAEVDSSSDDEFQDSKEVLPPRTLTESITAARIPQIATSQTTSQPQPDLSGHHVEQQTRYVESPQTPDSVESANTHTANLLEDIKYFQTAALSYQDAYEALQLQKVELQTKFTEQAQLVQESFRST